MSLEPGSTIASYTITREVGRGGMGVVYLAKDTRLDRDVAIKALPEELAADPARLERFEREARTLASLNHPNLAGIYGIEEQSGARYLVLEYVEGETIADILDRGPLPVDDALELAVQICAGIEAAHEAGVIHRDLKPANIKVTPEGKAKVLDFGLARADEGNTSASSIGLSNSPTVTSPVQHSPTIPGAILGTAPYMSPEQARGRKVDKRTDIWSFAVVLYEMLTGIGPFHGETATDSIGAILHKDVDLSLLPANTPSTVRRILTRCLARDKAQRYRDIADVRIELQSAGSAHSADIAPTRAPNKRLLPLAILAALLAGAGGWFAAQALSAKEPPHSNTQHTSYRTEVTLPEGVSIAGDPAISPDGHTLVYPGATEDDRRFLYKRPLNSYEHEKVPGTDNAEGAFFSPDGRWIGFYANGFLRKVSMDGGRPIDICKADPFGAFWSTDDTIYFGQFASAISTVPAAGGEPSLLTKLDTEAGEISHAHPYLLPDGDSLLYTVGTGEGSRIAAFSLSTATTRHFIASGTKPMHLFANVLLYARAGELLMTRYDPDTTETIDPIIQTMNDVRWGGWGGAENAGYAVSHNGTLIYQPSTSALDWSRLLLLDLEGNTTPIELPEGTYLHPALSPDGRSAAVTYVDRSLGTTDIWLVDIERQSATRLTPKSGTNYTPIWTPDGKNITYVSNGNIMSIRADATTEPEPLYAEHTYDRPLAWTPDGASLIFTSRSGAATDIMILHPDGTADPLLQSSHDERQPKLSPDGKRLAYISDETGRYEVYVRTFPDLGAKQKVSDAGGIDPMWSPDGSELYFRAGDLIMAATLPETPEPRASRPRMLFEQELFYQFQVTNMDIFPDGQRFIAVEFSKAYEREHFQIVSNWFAELNSRLKPSTP